MDCHGTDFSLQALADPNLVDTCYDGPPAGNQETMAMIRTRIVEIEERRRKIAERKTREAKQTIEENDL
jgi:hypothetical protein